MRAHQATPVRLLTRVFQDFGSVSRRVVDVCRSWRLQHLAGVCWQWLHLLRLIPLSWSSWC